MRQNNCCYKKSICLSCLSLFLQQCLKMFLLFQQQNVITKFLAFWVWLKRITFILLALFLAMAEQHQHWTATSKLHTSPPVLHHSFAMWNPFGCGKYCPKVELPTQEYSMHNCTISYYNHALLFLQKQYGLCSYSKHLKKVTEIWGLLSIVW